MLHNLLYIDIAHILFSVFLAKLLANLLLRLLAKIDAIISPNPYACLFVILVVPPIRNWNIFPSTLELG